MKKYFFSLLLFLCTLSISNAQSPSNYRVDTLAKNLWRIQAVKGVLSTAYLLEGSRSALLIDACAGLPGIKEIVTSLVGSKPVKVALTHGHFDHSGGIRYFTDVYMSAADTGFLPYKGNVRFHYIHDGSVFDLGGVKIRVIAIPGHTPGSVAFYNKATRSVFTGDGIGSSMVWMQISKLPLTVYLKSVKKLEAMKDDIDEIYVGHHEQEKVKLTRQYITDMRIVTEKVLNGTIAHSHYEMGTRSGEQAVYGSARLVYNPDNLR